MIKRVSIFMQLEVICTKKHQTQFKLLQLYIDKEAIVKRAQL